MRFLALIGVQYTIKSHSFCPFYRADLTANIIKNISIPVTNRTADHFPFEWEYTFGFKPLKVGKTNSHHFCSLSLIYQLRCDCRFTAPMVEYYLHRKSRAI